MIRHDEVRKEILMQLYAARPLSLGASRVKRDAVKAGYDYSEDEIKRELQFLSDNNLIVPMPNVVGTEKLFRIHANGVTHYENNFAA